MCSGVSEVQLQVETNQKMIEITSHYPPGIIKSPSTGHTYIVSGSWSKVPDNTTLSDIKWIKEEFSTTASSDLFIKVQSNTNPSVHYEVKRINNYWSCTCVRNAVYNRVCSHVTKEQNKLK